MSIRGPMIGKRLILVGLSLTFMALLGVLADAAQAGPIASYGSADVPVRITTIPPFPTLTPEPDLTIAHLPRNNPRALPVRITDGGCCPYPLWSLDSEWVMLFDAGEKGDAPGLYSIPKAGGSPTQLTERIGVYSQDWSLVAYPEAGAVYIERWVDGDRWVIPSQGRRVYFSPSGRQIAWEFGSRGIRHPDLRQQAIWLADVDGGAAHEVITVNGGQFIGWAAGEEAIIVFGRLAPYGPAGIWRVSTEDGAGRLLFEVEKPRSLLLSPAGGWLAFFVTFENQPDRNGLWIIGMDGSVKRHYSFIGAYRWRGEGQLLVIPQDLDAPGAYLWQIDIHEDIVWGLTDPRLDALPIASNDWQPSPDGSSIVFRSFEDHNLWVLTLPEPSLSP
ncbi:MAG: hypothetical protein MUO58_06975 [Anaerolineales bacterium]|nr:hypothetical protein [Anaerolineales bacterium]